MSTTAVSWALYDAPAGDPTARLILVRLAEQADRDGRHAFPSVPNIAEDIEVHERTVQRHLSSLEERGLISRGDQAHVSHYPPDRRPVVWDLNMSMRRERHDKTSPRSGRPPGKRGDTSATPIGKNGVTSASERGDTGVQNGVTPMSPKPSTSKPPMTPTESNQDPSLRDVSAHANAHTREETPPAQTAEEAPDAKVIPIPTSDSKRATRLPQDWKPSERMAEWTLEQGVTRDEAIRTLARFRDYWAAASGRNAAKKDWQAAWRNWVRDDIDRGRIGQQARRRAATTQLAWDAGVVYR